MDIKFLRKRAVCFSVLCAMLVMCMMPCSVLVPGKAYAAGEPTYVLSVTPLPSSAPDKGVVKLGNVGQIQYKHEGKFEVDKIPNKKDVLMLVDNSSAGINLPYSPFKYVLFSTTNIKLEGRDLTYQGDIFTCDSITSSAGPGCLKFNDGITKSTVECSDFVDNNHNLDPRIKKIDESTKLSYRDLDKFEFSTKIINEAQKYNNLNASSPSRSVFVDGSGFKDNRFYITTDPEGNYVDYKAQPGIESIPKQDKYKYRDFQVLGKDEFIVKSDMYFEGNLSIRVNKTKLESKVKSAFIIAKGNISIGGSEFSGGELNNVYIYSMFGNVEFITHGLNINNSMVFAPNGNIKFTGSDCTFTGNAIGKNIESNVSKVDFKSPDPSTTREVLSNYIDLYNLDKIKGSIKSFADSTATSPQDYVGLIKYDKDANSGVRKLDDDALDDWKKNEEATESNLGDAMRQAYYHFQSSDSPCKYAIILTGVAPNAATFTTSANTYLKYTDGNADYTKSTPRGLEYAINYANALKDSLKVKTYFIDLSKVIGASATKSLEDTAVKMGFSTVETYKYSNDYDNLKDDILANIARTIKSQENYTPAIKDLDIDSMNFQLTLPPNVIPKRFKMGDKAVVTFNTKVEEQGSGWSIINEGNQYTIKGPINSNCLRLIAPTKPDNFEYQYFMDLCTLDVTFTAKRSDYNKYKLNKPFNISGATTTITFTGKENGESKTYTKEVDFDGVTINVTGEIDVT